MSSSVIIGTLLRELRAIVWTYVGADLSDVILMYQEYAADPVLFRAKVECVTDTTIWYGMASRCAAFYENGFRWMRTLPLHIYWEFPICFAITRGNLSHLHDEVNTKETVPVPFTESSEFITANTADHKTSYVNAQVTYMIAALHADSPDKVFAQVCKELQLGENITQKFGLYDMGILRVYAAAKGVLGRTLPGKFCGTNLFTSRSMKSIENMFLDSIQMKNPYAVRYLLENTNAYVLNMVSRRDIIRTVLDAQPFSHKVARLLYDRGLLDGQDAYLIGCLHFLRDAENVLETFKFFARRAGLERAMALFRACFAANPPEHRTMALEWYYSVIQNDDGFWNEIGL